MTSLGSRLLQSAREAREFAKGEASKGFAVHKVVDVKALRKQQGLTQPAFSKRYGLPLGTIRDWEQGRSQPDVAARVLLQVIEKEPEVVARALEAP
jgi:putative transcriptional regulator